MSLPTGYLWGSYTFTGKGAAVDHIYQPAIVQNPTFNDGDSDGPFIAFFYGETTGTFNANGVNTVTNNVFALDPFLLTSFGPVSGGTQTVQKIPEHYALQATGSAGPGIAIVEG